MTRTELIKSLDEAALLPADASFRGTDWMNNLTRHLWSSSAHGDLEEYHPLFRLLFNIGFLGCRLSGTNSVLYNYDEA